MSNETLGRRIRVYGVGVVVLAVIGSAALFTPDAREAVVESGASAPLELSVRPVR